MPSGHFLGARSLAPLDEAGHEPDGEDEGHEKERIPDVISQGK